MFFGPLTNPKNQHLPDLTRRETLALAPLVGLIFVIGLFPGIFLDRMKDAVDLTHRQFKDISDTAVAEGNTHAALLLPAERFNAAFLKGAPPIKPKEQPVAAAAQPTPNPSHDGGLARDAALRTASRSAPHTPGAAR
jgi:NADH-quinone oxidoreductase subunit M